MGYETAIQNPQSLTALYSVMPTLDGVFLHEAVAHMDGPTFRLRFDLASFPDHPPKRWHPSFNTAQVTLALFFVTDLKIFGFQTTNVGDLQLNREEDCVSLCFESKNCSISAAGLFARIDKITGYLDERGVGQQIDPQNDP